MLKPFRPQVLLGLGLVPIIFVVGVTNDSEETLILGALAVVSQVVMKLLDLNGKSDGE